MELHSSFGGFCDDDNWMLQLLLHGLLSNLPQLDFIKAYVSFHKYRTKRIVWSKRQKALSVNVDITAQSFDSSVGIKTRYGLVGLGIEYRFGQDRFTGPNRLWAHLASCALGIGSLIRG